MRLHDQVSKIQSELMIGQSFSNVEIEDECCMISLCYKQLHICQDSNCIYLGEYSSEAFDVTINKGQVATIDYNYDNLTINLKSGKKLSITIEYINPPI